MQPISAHASHAHAGFLRLHVHSCAYVLTLMGVLAAPFAYAQKTALPSPALAREAPPVIAGERLSQWLLRRPVYAQDYLPGTLWLADEEKPAQADLKAQLLTALQTDGANTQLVEWIVKRPVTGRVTLASADALWLVVNPSQDPVLKAKDRVMIPLQPHNVSVLLDNGQVCQARHQPGAMALEYLVACTADAEQREVVWVVHPNGRQESFGIASWNAQSQMPPPPGSWLWAPQHSSRIRPSTSALLSKFLATQGMPADRGKPIYLRTSTDTDRVWTTAGLPAHQRLDDHQPLARDLPISANDFGETGLLQTPSARMESMGTIRTHISRTQPYTRWAIYFQPLDWLEGGFRYTDIADRKYDPTGVIASQSYKDKGLDLKVRLWPESRYIPQLALGLRDLGGTGLFAGEYLVASKRTGNFDWSLGAGWGYVGARGDFSNPLGLIAAQTKYRPRANVGEGGTVGVDSMFRGPVAVFGGVQWHSPWKPLVLKLELDGNNYQQEPSAQGFLKQSAPFNFGAVYRYSPTVDFSVGIERGNKIMAGITLRSKLANTGSTKVFDLPAPSVAPYQAPNTAPPSSSTGTATDIATAKLDHLQNTAATGAQHAHSTSSTDADALSQTPADIASLTDWNVRSMHREGSTLHVDVEDNGTLYRQERVNKILAVLHRDAPADITHWKLRWSNHGLGIQERTWDRAQWVQHQRQATTPTEKALAEAASAAQPAQPQPNAAANATPVFKTAEKFSGGLSPSFWQSFGGPDTFMLYQLGVQGSAEYRLTPSTWISGSGNLRVLDNYDKYKYTAPSELPRVRTHVREYVTRSRLTLSNLQLTHAKQLSTNQFASVYVGLLESMFAGVGAEWLYRPLGGRWALSVDINQVRQRDFEQRFSMLDYKVKTGHATLYWDTGWQGVQTKFSVGQYLAGDKGATLDISRTFDNGVVMGAWATKTNVSAEQFGEGSFDKGIYVSLPFDLMLPKSSPARGIFKWQPLMRDGGARLIRTIQLFDMTEGRDRMAWRYQPVQTVPQMQKTGATIFTPSATQP